MNQIEDKKIVAFSGFSRSGKNSFANETQKQLKEFAPNLKVEQFSFAAGLRLELDSFIRDNFNNISAWTEDDEEKRIIRPILIAYGNAKREISKGQYWIEKIDAKIRRSDCDVALITDLRFAELENDEIDWLKGNRGFNFHLKRFTLTPKTLKKKYCPAPNEFEAKNDPILEANAKKVIEVQSVDSDEKFFQIVEEEVSKIIGYFL